MSKNLNHQTNSVYNETEYDYEPKGQDTPTDFYNTDYEKEISINSQKHSEEHELGTKRGLDARHIQMISLGGSIG
jgi:amino acid permease